jgi:hypothetical protein
MIRAAMLGIALIALGATCIGHAAAASAPGVLLFGATPDAARDFAVASAQARGWSITGVGPTKAEFEQVLDEGDPDDTFAVRRLIRISARFAEETGGTRVLLHAREVLASATGDEWTTDVTERYAENLENALTSLRSKWDGRRAADPIGAQTYAAPATTPEEESGSRAHAEPVGTWAYYAERYAESRGCELTDAETVLEATGAEWEQHRVTCRDGRVLRVHCRRGDCTSRD